MRYQEEYEIQGNEDVWEKAFRQGYINMWGFDEESVGEAAHQAWWEYDADMETVDWGDSDSENFEIEISKFYSFFFFEILNEGGMMGERGVQ